MLPYSPADFTAEEHLYLGPNAFRLRGRTFRVMTLAEATAKTLHEFAPVLNDREYMEWNHKVVVAQRAGL